MKILICANNGILYDNNTVIVHAKGIIMKTFKEHSVELITIAIIAFIFFFSGVVKAEVIDKEAANKPPPGKVLSVWLGAYTGALLSVKQAIKVGVPASAELLAKIGLPATTQGVVTFGAKSAGVVVAGMAIGAAAGYYIYDGVVYVINRGDKPLDEAALEAIRKAYCKVDPEVCDKLDKSIAI